MSKGFTGSGKFLLCVPNFSPNFMQQSPQLNYESEEVRMARELAKIAQIAPREEIFVKKETEHVSEEVRMALALMKAEGSN
jgi:hypothetical protein